MTSFWTHMGKTIKWNHCDNPSEGSISRIRKFTSNLQNKTKQMLYSVCIQAKLREKSEVICCSGILVVYPILANHFSCSLL